MSSRADKASIRWGALWCQKNQLDGVTEHLMVENSNPVLFRTRQEAREWIDKRCGYIRLRPDLRREPYGWRMPIPVRVRIVRVRDL